MIIFSLLITTIAGLLLNVVATWIEPTLSRSKRLTIVVLIGLTFGGIFFTSLNDSNSKVLNNGEIKPNFEISSKGVAGIKLGTNIEQVKEIFGHRKEFTISVMKSPGDNDFQSDAIIVLDDKHNDLFEMGFTGDIVTEFYVYSSQYKTYNGVHPKMKIKDFRKIYKNLSLEESLAQEIFTPFDLQDSKNKVTIDIGVKSSKGEN